jgi:hypothetical protein
VKQPEIVWRLKYISGNCFLPVLSSVRVRCTHWRFSVSLSASGLSILPSSGGKSVFFDLFFDANEPAKALFNVSEKKTVCSYSANINETLLKLKGTCTNYPKMNYPARLLPCLNKNRDTEDISFFLF